jgi:MauM/NapG family ferredoxin protein
MSESKSVRLKVRKIVNKWQIARNSLQAISLAVFVLTLVFSKESAFPTQLTNGLVRISPLAMLTGLLSSKVFLTGSLLGLVILLSSVVVGRAWCGWLCPMGTLLDVFSFSKIRIRKELPQSLRKIKYALLIITLVAAIFGNLTLLVFDPITIFIRSTTLVIWPLLDKGVFSLEKLLINVPFLRESVFKADAWMRPSIFPMESTAYQYATLFGLFFAAILLLNLLAERFWCRYLCPLGAVLGLGSRFSLIQRRVNNDCMECGLCGKACPTGTIDVKNGYQSDPAECTLCMNCHGTCHKNVFVFTPKWEPAEKQAYDPGRRLFLSTIGFSAVSVVLLSLNWAKKKTSFYLLRPPGVQDEENFLSTCVRCGVCIQVCPTQAIQADLTLSGIEGLTTPILVPRAGYCAYTCNACGQNCPVQAIPPLSLEGKRLTKIGTAQIDHTRCIAWGEHGNCIVCEEMCPLPHKAISLKQKSFTQADGKVAEVLLPIVDETVCIGCGICENKCPVEGEAAIRVFSL